MNRSKHMKLLSIAIAIGSLGAMAPALAQDMPPMQDEHQPQSTPPDASSQAGFARLDADHDAAISKSEAAADAGLNAAFDGLDADANGSLSQAEYDKYAQASQQGVKGDDTSGDDHDKPGSGSR